MNSRMLSFLIVGLGNYTHPSTRHSVGQVLLESFAARLGIQLKDDKSTLSWIGQKEVEVAPPQPKAKSKKRPRRILEDSNQTVDIEPLPVAEEVVEPYRVNLILVKPKLLMNVSGKSVALAHKHYFRATPSPSSLSRVIVLHDSLSHKPLSLHPRIGGSANGHNGVTSVMSSLSAGPNFHRIRIGIDRPSGGGEYGNYVLQKMERGELEHWGTTGEGVEKAWEIVESIILKEVQSTGVVKTLSSN